jgi:hypothetical protein
MIRRPAVTLMEVMIAMFIMAIGMLSLLALFPVGAVSMAQALKDDRCASTAAMAENVAIAMEVRHDANVTAHFATSTLVYVDPYGKLQPLTALGGVIPREAPSFASTPAAADRWFSLPDGITFLDGGVPDTSTGNVDRDRRYSYAYLLRLLSPSNLVQLYVVVYSGRPTGVLTPETTLAATVSSTNSVLLATSSTTAKRGGWILSLDTSAGNTAANTLGTLGNFYRITNVTDAGGTTTLETQQNFPAAAVNGNISIVIMDNVAEVFDKGTSWQP